MKKTLSKTIMVILLLSLLLTSVVYVPADSKSKGNKSKDSFDENKYQSVFHSIGSVSYNDKMMLTDAREESGDLAKLSVVLADNAYEEGEIKSSLESIGYHFLPFNYDNEPTYDNNDFVAFSIGHKEIEYKGTTYNAYIVPIRGTKEDCQWYSDFHLGSRIDGYHQGFKVAANEVLAKIANVVKTNNNIFLFTGHSRGAAVSNIVAAELTMANSLASPNHIFSYNYACPAVRKNADSSLKNIRNYNNVGDPIAAVPLKEWGFSRYGKDITLSTQTDIYNNFKNRFKDKQQKEYAGSLSKESFVNGIKTIASTQDAYNQDNNKLLFDIAAYYLGGKTNSDLMDVLSHHKLALATQKAIFNICTSGAIGDFNYYFNSNYNENLSLLSDIDIALSNTGGMSSEEFNLWKYNNGSLLWHIEDAVDVTVEKREDLVKSRDLLNDMLSDTSYICPNIASLLHLYFANGEREIFDTIYDAHVPYTYILWINTLFFGPNGWRNNPSCKSITIDKPITVIESSCFRKCQQLEKVSINNAEVIEYENFYFCEKLKEVTMADCVKTIGKKAFQGCSDLEEITMPISTEYITSTEHEGSSYFNDPINTFDDLNSLKKLHYTVGTGKTFACGRVGPGGSETKSSDSYNVLEEVIFDEGITEIADRMLSQGKNIKKVTLPSTLKRIGEEAFYNCSNWSEEIVCPNGLADIGERAFSYSGIIGFKKIPNTVEVIPNDTFRGCKNIDSIYIPQGTKEIGYGCFYGCSGLKTLTINDSVEIIGSAAFQDCYSLEEIVMPISTEYNISTDNYGRNTTFSGLNSLKKLHYTVGTGKTFACGRVGPGGSETKSSDSYNVLEEVIFDEGITEIADRMLSQGKNITKVTLPSTLKRIGEEAFYNCSNWSEEIDWPSGLTSIGESAFCWTKIKGDILFPNTLESIGGRAFRGCTSISSVTVGKDCDVGLYSDTFAENTLIKSHNKSSAKEYADKYNRQFVSLCDGHYKESIVPPTVDEEGYTSHKCSICGDEYRDNYVDKLVKPDEPKSLAFEEKADGSISISWTSEGPTNFNIYINGELVESTSSESIILDDSYFKKAGEYIIEVTAVSDENAESDRVSVTYFKEEEITDSAEQQTTLPVQKETQISKVLGKKYITRFKKIKAKKKALKLSWRKISGVNGYQIKYSLKKNFKKSKTITIKKASVGSKTIKKLKRKKKYYFKIRTYIVRSGKSIYSLWSKTKSKKTK